MKLVKASTIMTRDEARQLAIDFQDWASEEDLSYSELIEWQALFETLGVTYGLTGRVSRKRDNLNVDTN